MQPSLYELIEAHLRNAPDKPIDEDAFPKIQSSPEPGAITFAAGSLNAMAGRFTGHGGETDWPGVRQIFLEIGKKIHNWQVLEQRIGPYALLPNIRALKDFETVPLAQLGTKIFRDLALNTRQYESVKWGIAVGSLDEAPDFAPPLFVFAQHSEFSVYAINALLQSYSRLPGFKQRLLALLPRLRQWGIIKTIELLLTTSDFAKDPVVQRECLINGMKYNDGIPMEIAFTLASHIDVRRFLEEARIQRPVFVAFSEMMNTLLTDPRPLGGLQDLPGSEELFAAYVDLLEQTSPDIYVLGGLRAALEFLQDDETRWAEKEHWRKQIQDLVRQRESVEVLSAGLKESSKSWVALSIILEKKFTQLLPEVEALFAQKPDYMNIQVLRELGGKDQWEALLLKIPELVTLPERGKLPMSKVNVFGPEHKNNFEYAEIVKSLGRLGTPAAVSHLKRALRDYDPIVRKAACEAVGDLDRASIDLEISTLMEERLLDSQPYVADAARQASGRLGLLLGGESSKPN